MSSDPMSAFVTQLQSRDWKARKTAVEALELLLKHLVDLEIPVQSKIYCP